MALVDVILSFVCDAPHHIFRELVKEQEVFKSCYKWDNFCLLGEDLPGWRGVVHLMETKVRLAGEVSHVDTHSLKPECRHGGRQVIVDQAGAVLLYPFTDHRLERLFLDDNLGQLWANASQVSSRAGWLLLPYLFQFQNH